MELRNSEISGIKMNQNKEAFKRAMRDWKLALGNDRVIVGTKELDSYRNNEIKASREVPLALKPRNSTEVVALVKIAKKHKIPLYPVSTGNNWGYGAASPVIDDCVVVDLSNMDKILNLDEELGLVTVEPGVTLLKLRQYLDQRKSSYLVPVSGAGPHASLLGNAIERGYGVTPYADHFGAVTSLEVVLPDGNTYRPALTENGGSLIDQTFKWGLGPYLDGIFTQANFGIVTNATIALATKPQKVECFIIGIKKENYLEESVIAVRDILKAVGGVTGSINIMNARRILSMVEDYPFERTNEDGIMPDALVDELIKKNYLGPWTIGGVIYGQGNLLTQAKKLIKKRLKSISRRNFFFSRKSINFLKFLTKIAPEFIVRGLKKQLRNLDESFKVAEGSPSEIALPLCYWKSGKKPLENQTMNPAKDGCGVIWYSPLVPMKSKIVRSYTDMVNQVCIRNKIEPLITLTSFSPRCFDSTVPILFNPNDNDETNRAKNCYKELYDKGKKLGLLPYRMGIDHMDLATKKGTVYWDLVSKIKKVIDPDGIIAPGRYCPR